MTSCVRRSKISIIHISFSRYSLTKQNRKRLLFFFLIYVYLASVSTFLPHQHRVVSPDPIFLTHVKLYDCVLCPVPRPHLPHPRPMQPSKHASTSDVTIKFSRSIQATCVDTAFFVTQVPDRREQRDINVSLVSCCLSLFSDIFSAELSLAKGHD